MIRLLKGIAHFFSYSGKYLPKMNLVANGEWRGVVPTGCRFDTANGSESFRCFADEYNLLCHKNGSFAGIHKNKQPPTNLL